MSQAAKAQNPTKQPVSQSVALPRRTRRNSKRARRLFHEALEDRRLLAGTQLPLTLPGMHLVDPGAARFDGQRIYVDFDGAENVTYDGPVKVQGIDVPAFRTPGALASQEQSVVSDVLLELRSIFAGTGIEFTTHKSSRGAVYSTVYVGGDGSRFTPYGPFLGLAEHVDVGNLNPNDNAFVFSEALESTATLNDYEKSLADVIAHETGHLLGFAHDGQRKSLPSLLGDVAESWELIHNGAFEGTVSTSDWPRTGYFQADSRGGFPHGGSGYSYMSGLDAQPANNLWGDMYQQFAVTAQ